MALPKKKISLKKRKIKISISVKQEKNCNLISCQEFTKTCYYPLKLKGTYCKNCIN